MIACHTQVCVTVHIPTRRDAHVSESYHTYACLGGVERVGVCVGNHLFFGGCRWCCVWRSSRENSSRSSSSGTGRESKRGDG